MSNKFPPPILVPDYYCVGFVRAAHGIRGELFIGLFAARADWLDLARDIYLIWPNTKDLKTYPIEQLRPHKEGFILKVRGIETRADAEPLKRGHIYIPESWLVSPPGEPIYLREIEGFTLVDPQDVVLGVITGFSSNGSQDLLLIQADQGRALVPFVEAFLLDIDFDKRQVRMDLPPGLFELEG